MKCQQVEFLISAYVDGEVTSSEWQQAKKHIAVCQRCAQTLVDFQLNATMFKHKLQIHAPSQNFWTKLESRIQGLHPPSAITSLKYWGHEFFATFLFRPPAHVRALQVGFAIVLLVILFTNKLQQPVTSQNVVSLSHDYLVSQRKLESAQNREQLMRLALTQEIQSYFDQTGLLLMEIKNSEPEQEKLDLSHIRKTSQNLLEKTVFIKKDLQNTELNDLKSTIENLELILFELANLKAEHEKTEVEMLKATILQHDILIKIEIFDAKSLELQKSKIINEDMKQGHKVNI
ncbi:MAG: anti-sigma factor family protein [bacterium]